MTADSGFAVGACLRALSSLRVSRPELAAQVVHMLGQAAWPSLTRRPVTNVGEPVRADADAPMAPVPARPEALKVAGPVRPASPAAGAGDTTADDGTVQQRRARMRVRQLEPASIPPWPAWAQAGDGAAARPMEAGTGYEDLAPAPLIAAAQQRAVLSALVAATGDLPEFDIDPLIERLARGEALDRLPRQRGARRDRGLQVLADRGPGMAPFAHDLDQLRVQLQSLIPSEQLEWLEFDGTPLRGVSGARGAGSRKRRAGWRPPSAGTPVLLVSELGHAVAEDDPWFDVAEPDEWRRFASVAARHRVSLRTLVPLARWRWVGLERLLNGVVWDLETSAAQVARRLLRGARATGISAMPGPSGASGTLRERR